MRRSWRRMAVTVAVLLAGVVGGWVAAAPAQAQTVASGSVSFSGDPGDYITGAGSYAYSTDNGDGLSTFASTDNSHISININAYNGDWWYLDFDAPGTQPLATGTYDNATRYPFNGTGPARPEPERQRAWLQLLPP
jgi:hypothetical protein